MPFCSLCGRGDASASASDPTSGVLRPDRQARSGLGPARRIGGRSGFEALLRTGTRRKVAGFTFILSRREAGPARLGIMISRKHSPRANVRNAIKRRIREAFRAEHHALGPIDVLVRPPIGVPPSAAMVAKLRQAFARLGAP